MPVAKRSISLSLALAASVRPHGASLSSAIQVAIERYLEILERERAVLRASMSEEEIGGVTEALRHRVDPALVPAAVAEYARGDHDQRLYRPDWAAVLAKLAALSYPALVCLEDAAERYHRQSDNEGLEADEALD